MSEEKKNGVPWHTMPVEMVLGHLGASVQGLSDEEGARRLAEYGSNELQKTVRISPWSILLQQFKNILIIILLIATALSAFLGHGLEAIVITIIVLFAVLLGFFQEYRAERAIEALRQLAAPTATVLRGGEERKIPARELVPGDIVLLHVGDRVPADMRLIEAVNLKIEEAPLTGESHAVDKDVAPLPEVDVPVGDRWCMAFAGTAVVYGRGKGVIVATGMHTEFGKIAQMLQTIETGRTPLQENLDRVGHVLARSAFVIVALIVAIGLLRGQPIVEMLLFGIALAVAVVPEALPAVVTISLAIGVQRMVKRHALVRKLPAVETLASTSVICTDKTGTLTKDEMTVRSIFADSTLYEITGSGYEPTGHFLQDGRQVELSPPLRKLLLAGALCSDARITYSKEKNRWQLKGDPTEGALVVAAAKAGIDKVAADSQYPRIREIPFTSERKSMTTLHNESGQVVAYSKGAPEVIIDRCKQVLTHQGEVAWDPNQRQHFLDQAKVMAGKALRVLALAYRNQATLENAEHDMTFLGLVGMSDPPRPEVKNAIRTCEQAGIRAVMITGDHPLTARAVASELGMMGRGRVITGTELDQMPDTVFRNEVQQIDVYARVSPAHKLRVVTALQEHQHIVAMTGDGVNDAPALKKADIGIAMGITGTDVSKEVAAMTLTDDNFASIVAAVEEGRRIYSNIKKYLMYLLSSNVGEVVLVAGATLLGFPMPLTAVQILYVNLATDGLPALALAVDPPDADLMQRPPRNPRSGIFNRPVITLLMVGGLWSACVNLALFIWALHSGRPYAEAITMTFVSLVLIQFFKAYNFRSDIHSVLQRPFANRWLNAAIIWELVLLVLIVYLPFFHEPFGTFSLTWQDWVIVVVLSSTISPVLELAKWIQRRQRKVDEL